MTARYYMKYTGMSQDEVERNTCRDFFMTPEDAVQHGGFPVETALPAW